MSPVFTTASDSKFRGLIRLVLAFFQSILSYAQLHLIVIITVSTFLPTTHPPRNTILSDTGLLHLGSRVSELPRQREERSSLHGSAARRAAGADALSSLESSSQQLRRGRLNSGNSHPRGQSKQAEARLRDRSLNARRGRWGRSCAALAATTPTPCSSAPEPRDRPQTLLPLLPSSGFTDALGHRCLPLPAATASRTSLHGCCVCINTGRDRGGTTQKHSVRHVCFV